MPALADPVTRHGVFVERLKSGEVRKFLPFLREMDKRLREALTREGLTAFRRERLASLLAEVDGLLRDVLGRFTRQLEMDLREFAQYEAGFTGKMLDAHGFAYAMPAPALIAQAAFTEPLSAGKGKLLTAFIADWSDSQREAVTGAIRLGVAQGQAVGEMVQAIRGTKALQYADGLLAVTNRQAEAVVRTAVAHVGASARQQVFAANDDLFAGLQWDATLDGRTCTRCGALDGRVFAMGKGPVEPLHVSCRCVRVPLLSDEFAFLSEGEKRASANGPVDGTTRYYEWLKTQPSDFQDAAIGPKRGALLRNGGLSAERFAQLQLDRRFEPMTLDEMRALEPLAFKRAGI